MFNRKSGKKFIFLLFIGLLIVAAISLTCGQIKIPLHNTLSAIGYQLGLPFFDKNDFTQEQMAVVWYISRGTFGRCRFRYIGSRYAGDFQ